VDPGGRIEHHLTARHRHRTQRELYVSQDTKAFRKQAVSPKGGEERLAVLNDTEGEGVNRPKARNTGQGLETPGRGCGENPVVSTSSLAKAAKYANYSINL
jgi:hypothetical protein